MFTTNLVPEIADYPYDETCTIVSTNTVEPAGPTVVHLDCVVPEDFSWAPQTLEIVANPNWQPPPMGTQLRLRLLDDTGDGSGFAFRAWRFDLLESGELVAAMILDTSGGSSWTYAEWGIATEIIWDGCVDDCDDAHDLWFRMTVDGESVTMFPGDSCSVGNYQLWLNAAWGYDCSEPPTTSYGAEILVLNTRHASP